MNYKYDIGDIVKLSYGEKKIGIILQRDITSPTHTVEDFCCYKILVSGEIMTPSWFREEWIAEKL